MSAEAGPVESLRIERGRPSPEEVAVLAAVLTRRQTPCDADVDAERPGRVRAGWKPSGMRQPGGWGAP
ncbi:acyl-CoA carboxylase epsilon subunit [Streptacidiphilus fuscans]|uniref:Acyl-CoA carboxylase subunit epsilon n=1 Tax=Streptacidiphilus fuscans TaxID=2789292 RepID=A0A931B165_9ACTN|nr:acyl-CoA carboxylase epsilon subunit [Streptacidiphilus fuscans]MBF9068411.1 acyl-CoA carboxylase subunit epsilon [Streptacidiphilus fuscans]